MRVGAPGEHLTSREHSGANVARACSHASQAPRRGRVRGMRALLGLALALAPLGALPLHAQGAGTGTTAPVTLALEWTPNANDTGIYVALKQGLYARQGIALTLLPYSSAVAPETLVASGRADVGVSYEPSVISSRAAGQPLVSIAAVIQRENSAVVSLKSSGLDTMAKLAGKRYAGYGGAFEQAIISQALACGAGHTVGFRNITTDLDPVGALQSKQFDFTIMAQGWGITEAQYKGVALNVFPITRYCVPDDYGLVLVSSERAIAGRPDVLRRFLAATAQGYTYAARHPGDAAMLLVASAPHGTFESQAEIQASQRIMSSYYLQGARCWGMQTRALWTNYPRFMFERHAIKDTNGHAIAREPDAAAAYTNLLLPSCP